jgi:hypothetical protein
MSLEEIYKKAEHVDEHFAELIPVTLPIMDEYEGKIRDVVTKHVHALLQANNIDAALDEVKKGLRKEVSIQ